MSHDEAPPAYYTPPRRAGVRPMYTRRIHPLTYDVIQQIFAEQRELWETRGTPPEYEESAVPSVPSEASHGRFPQNQESQVQDPLIQHLDQEGAVRPQGPPPQYCHPAVRLAREAHLAEEWRQRDLARLNEPELRDDDLVARSTAYSRCTRWKIQPGYRYVAMESNTKISREVVEAPLYPQAVGDGSLHPSGVVSGDGPRNDRVVEDQPVWDLRVAELARRRKKTGRLARLLATVDIMVDDYDCVLDGKAPREDFQHAATAEPSSRVVCLWHRMLVRRKGQAERK
ncbi:hypothetical protein LTR17_012060 [Elasticomyces elasticus]|nr:hypothetical protein LTR17_012060 [Elasticomyces elasticus]